MKKINTIFVFLLSVFLFLSPSCKTNDESEPSAYASPEMWAYYGEGEAETSVDVFLIAPTVDIGRDGNINMKINDEMCEIFIDALNMMRGVYDKTCALYAPFYRQMSMLVYTDETVDIEKARKIARDDIFTAFDEYLLHLDDGEPIVIAGFSQGSEMALNLIKEYGEVLYDRLVAAYLIGWRVTEEDLSEYVVPAKGEKDTGVFISFNSEAASVKESIIVLENCHTISINPLNWKTDGTFADKSLNLGACFPDQNGEIDRIYEEYTGAYLSSERGTLVVTDINADEYQASAVFPRGVYHVYDYLFFYQNLKQNVSARCEAFMNK